MVFIYFGSIITKFTQECKVWSFLIVDRLSASPRGRTKKDCCRDVRVPGVGGVQRGAEYEVNTTEIT